MKKTTCIVLAAGYATRMYPLCENFPKPLLKVGEKAILDWLVDDVSQSCAIKDFVIISNHKFLSFFRDWADTKKGMDLNINVLDDGSTDNDNSGLSELLDGGLVVAHDACGSLGPCIEHKACE